MPTKTDVSKTKDREPERCPNCDYCPHCGRSKMDTLPPAVGIPYPYPVFPPPQPYIPWLPKPLPYTIWTQPNFSISGGSGGTSTTGSGGTSSGVVINGVSA